MPGIVLLFLRFALAAALYLFLAWAFVTLWNSLRYQGQIATQRRAPPLLLFSAAASQDQFRFTRAEVVIGRATTSDLVLDNDTVSSQHSRLTYRQNQWWVEDLNSTNGTTLNETPISNPAVLTSGDVIGCGEVELLVSIEEMK